jgi:3-deoxy-D-manno-octulosonate 8-phosphate phosphatase KdsC-like HAD superfamily phosphatase
MLQILILDVDGVLTDGTKLYDINSKVIGKSFCDLDWTAIKKFQSIGWLVCMLSADKNVNEAVAKDRNIDFWYSREDDGTIDKVKWLTKLIGPGGHYVSNQQDKMHVVYVGDDLFDLPIMGAVLSIGGHAYCPLNAAPQLKNDLRIRTLKQVGGHGVIMELFNQLYPLDNIPPRH